MKKIPNKNSKTNKTKIQLKIKSKNVTNNFILTPRTVSPRSQRQLLNKTERFVEDSKCDRQKLEELIVLKGVKEGKKQQYRVINTDYTRSNFKKKMAQDQTGTQTPIPRKISMATQGINKKKSSNSLIHTESTKLRKNISDKPIKSQSSELNKATLQRVIGIIINDFKEGRLKQKQLQKALIELYDRKQKIKTTKKSKKKEQSFATLSNQFLRSRYHNLKSKNKAKNIDYEEQITQRILEREGFVNKIIVKGITTSMFLKDDFNASNIKQNQVKDKQRQQSFNIQTSKSIKEINQQMRIIQQNFNKLQEYQSQTLQDIMATKIQRAWKRYRTRKIVKAINVPQENVNPIHILDQFTDQENSQQQATETNKELKRSKVGEIVANQYANLVKMISESLQSKNLSKQECLKNILNYLKFPEDTCKIQDEKINQPTQTKQIQGLLNKLQKKEADQSYEQLGQSRVKILKFDRIQQDFQADQNGSKSSDEQINSFTNKYSSKQVENQDYFKDKLGQASELDKSLTFAHSQTLAADSFKTINIQNIEQGLQSREQLINAKKEKEIEQLTQQYFNNKISRDKYQQQRNKIDKWFKSQQKELKKVKNSLLKSCYEARKILENDFTILKNEKSKKMLKCLSDKYIKNNDWTNRSIIPLKSNEKRLKCQQKQQSLVKTPTAAQDKEDCILQNISGQKQVLSIKHSSFEQSQKNELNFQISPKLSRNERLEQSQRGKDYNYQQIQGVIQQEDDCLQQGLNKFQQKVQLSSEKLIQNEEAQLDEAEEHEFTLINKLVNDERKKLKYLCTEDKQDIFEFLFLDLVLQMFTQNVSGQSRILRAAEVYINKAKKLKKIPKGIKTNIASSKQYLKVLSQYVLKEKGTLKNLSASMGPSAIQMLKYMREQIVQADDQQSISSTLVIPLEIFQKVSKLPELQLKLQRYYDDEQKQQGRISFLKTALNINNKSLFDSLNQILDHQRPYGVWGKPFPWKKVLSIDRKWAEQQQKKKMKKSIQKTIEACSYLCGIIVDKQDSLFGSHRVSQEYVLHIREDRLSKMLANDLVENQQRWIFYDDEQTQILMDVSSYVTKRLIKEVVLELISLRMRF